MSSYEIIDVILSSLNIGAVLFLAYRGFDIWKKRQFLLEKHDLARDLLKSVHLLRKKIEYVRSPFMTAGEIAEGIRNLEGDTPDDQDQKRALGEINAYFKRWEGVADIGSDFETQKIEASVVLGIDVEKLFKDFLSIINDVKMALRFYGMNKRASAYNQTSPISKKDMHTYLKNLMQGYSKVDDEDDPIDTRFDRSIKSIEKNLKQFFELEEKPKIKK